MNMTSGTTSDFAGPRKYKLSGFMTYYVFTLLFLLYFFDYVDRMIVTSLFPYIREEWGLTDTELGLLVSVLYWSIVAFVFPVSILVDRWSRKKTVAIMALIWSVATALCAFAKSFPHLVLARSGIGIGEAGYAPAGTAMLSGLFPPEKRSRMMGLWNMSIPLGVAVGTGLGGFVAEHWGWRHAFGLVAIPGAITAILFLFVKDYKTVELVKTVEKSGSDDKKVRMSKMDIIREFIHTPSLILTDIGFIGCIFVNNAIIVWLPTYFHRMTGAPMTEAGLKTGMLMLLAIVGLPLGGWLADMWFKKNVSSRMLFPAVTIGLNAVVIFIAFSLLDGNRQYVGAFVDGPPGEHVCSCRDHGHAGGYSSRPSGHFLLRVRCRPKPLRGFHGADRHWRAFGCLRHQDGHVDSSGLPRCFGPAVFCRLVFIQEGPGQSGKDRPGM